MAISRKEAAQYLLRVRKASENFEGFVRLNHPDFELANFQLKIINALDKVESGEIQRLLLTVPPRHGKSWLTSWQFPPYFLARNPGRQIIAASYNSELATDFGRRVIQYAKEPYMGQAFPNFELAQESRAVDRWMTTMGGMYVGTGIFGTVTGRGADLVIIDDPIKERSEADSVTIRNKIWSAYTSALSSRLHKGGRIIVIQTRWHPDDLAGRLLKSENWDLEGWVHIDFPAIQQIETGVEVYRYNLEPEDPRYLPRKECISLPPGQRLTYETREAALWPEHFPLERLKQQRKLDPREFASLYQQSPYLEGGNLIKDSWWQFYKPDPKSTVNAPSDINIQAIVIGFDTAFKDKEMNDYSAAVIGAVGTDGNIYILHVWRDRLDFPALKRQAIQLNNKYRGRGLVGVYVEDKASGQSLIQELKNESGVPIIPWRKKGDKFSKTQSITPLIQGGRVFLPENASWVDDFVQEHTEFPNGTHDDQVDAHTIVLDVLSTITLQADNAFRGDINLENSLFTQVARQTNHEALKDLSKLNHSNVWRGWGE